MVGAKGSITAKDVKEIVLSSGADLCGIAAAGRFTGAPAGFQPTDVYSVCKSVVVFAKRLPAGALLAQNVVPYTIANTAITQKVDLLTLEICRRVEDVGIGAVPIPSDDPYEHWQADRSYGRAILSLRHAGYLAGLGVLGKNTLLLNDKFGNMIHIGAVLVDAELSGDPLAEYEACISNCRLCLDACPAGALDGETVSQKLCRPLSNFRTQKGYVLKKCYRCRAICPHAAGMKR